MGDRPRGAARKKRPSRGRARDALADAIPGRLADINFIFYRSEEERPDGLQKLLKALTTDLAWEREKTRINDLAMVWENAGRPVRLLTWREDAIRALERWRDAHPATSPAPTDVQMAFISECRSRFTRRQRWIRGGLATGLTVMTGLAIAAVFFGLQSEERRAEAETQRAAADAQRMEAERQEKLAVEQRNQALTTQSLFLGDLAEQPEQRGATGMLLALAGLPDKTAVTGARHSDRPYASEAERALFASQLVNRDRAVLAGHAGAVTSVAFSPDGTRLATASRDDTARLWDAETGAEIAVLRSHAGDVRFPTFRPDLAFSPDGTRLATNFRDGTVRLWDAETGAEIVVFRGNAGGVFSAAFSRTAPGSPPFPGTTRRGCGTPRPGPRSTCFRAMTAMCSPRRSARTAPGSPPPPTTARRGCGTPRPGSRSPCSGAMPAL